MDPPPVVVLVVEVVLEVSVVLVVQVVQAVSVVLVVQVVLVVLVVAALDTEFPEGCEGGADP